MSKRASSLQRQASRHVIRQVSRSLWRFLKTHPKLIGVALLIALAVYGYEVQFARPAMAFEGVPKHQTWSDSLTTRIMRNEAFMVGYSETLGNPLWVSYQVLPKSDNPARLPRPDRFNADWRSARCWLLLPCINHDDYTGSGYDRGHMAPNHVIATRYGQTAQHQTFLMTNITPQKPDLNRKAWQRLEEIAANNLADKHAPFWVVTGPIFDAQPDYLPGAKRIAIARAFYKIFIRPRAAGEPPMVLAFILPQAVKGNEDLRQFLTSVREIEQQTGLDFFHQLDDGVETYIETLIAPEEWGFDRALATRKAHYD
ncbi:MAG: DNA/RNA non-specific endonuclease [Thiomicrospira sp.]